MALEFPASDVESSLFPEQLVVLHDGRTLNQRELFLAISSHLKNPSFLHSLARSLDSSEATAMLHDGRCLSKRALLVEALRFSPDSSPLLHDLARTLSCNETVMLHNGRTFDQRELLLEALRFSPNDATLLHNLARSLSYDETVTLEDEQSHNRKQLLVEAFRFSPDNAAVLLDLADSLEGGGDDVALHDGRVLNERELCVLALHINTKFAMAYYRLGRMLEPGESAALQDGRILSKPQLILEALRLDSKMSCAFAELAQLVCNSHPWFRASNYNGPPRVGERILLPDGRSLNSLQLLEEALLLDETNMDALNLLVEFCPPRDYTMQGKNMFHLCLEALVRVHAPNKHHASMRQREFRMYQKLRFHVALMEGMARASMPWSYQVHMHFVLYLIKRGIKTNKLFATLLLGLQRLEDTSVLPQAHRSMLEDMLEGWTWIDSIELGRAV